MKRKYKFRKSSIEEFDALNRVQGTVLTQLSRNTPDSRDTLLNILGLEIFNQTSSPPEGYRRSGGKLIDKSGEKFSLFSFGHLKGCHRNSLTNFFRLAVLVLVSPMKEKKFYIHNLGKWKYTRQHQASERFIITHLENFKSKRKELIFKKIIKDPKKKTAYIRNSLILLHNMVVTESDNNPFTHQLNFRVLNKMIREAKE